MPLNAPEQSASPKEVASAPNRAKPPTISLPKGGGAIRGGGGAIRGGGGDGCIIGAGRGGGAGRAIGAGRGGAAIRGGARRGGGAACGAGAGRCTIGRGGIAALFGFGATEGAAGGGALGRGPAIGRPGPPCGISSLCAPDKVCPFCALGVTMLGAGRAVTGAWLGAGTPFAPGTGKALTFGDSRSCGGFCDDVPSCCAAPGGFGPGVGGTPFVPGTGSALALGGSCPRPGGCGIGEPGRAAAAGGIVPRGAGVAPFAAGTGRALALGSWPP